MTEDQRQIILGTLLGNGFICNAKNNYLCIQHSYSYFYYLKSKIFYLEEFNRKNSWYYRGNVCGWRSQCSPIWNEFKRMCYVENTKTVTMAWLDELKAVGLAVWYADSGCLTGYKKRNACLRTQSFMKQGNEVIERYFNEIGINCKLNKSKNSQIILFSVSGTKTLLKLIAPFIHKSLYNKLITNTGGI